MRTLQIAKIAKKKNKTSCQAIKETSLHIIITLEVNQKEADNELWLRVLS